MSKPTCPTCGQELKKVEDVLRVAISMLGEAVVRLDAAKRRIHGL